MPSRSRATRVPATRRRQPHPLRALAELVPSRPLSWGALLGIEDLTVCVRAELNRIIDPSNLAEAAAILLRPSAGWRADLVSPLEPYNVTSSSGCTARDARGSSVTRSTAIAAAVG